MRKGEVVERAVVDEETRYPQSDDELRSVVHLPDQLVAIVGEPQRLAPCPFPCEVIADFPGAVADEVKETFRRVGGSGEPASA